MNENKVETGSPDATYFCEKVCENKVEVVLRTTETYFHKQQIETEFLVSCITLRYPITRNDAHNHTITTTIITIIIYDSRRTLRSHSVVPREIPERIQ